VRTDSLVLLSVLEVAELVVEDVEDSVVDEVVEDVLDSVVDDVVLEMLVVDDSDVVSGSVVGDDIVQALSLSLLLRSDLSFCPVRA